MYSKSGIHLGQIVIKNLLTKWAKYAIYGAIDKIPEICRHAFMWGKMGLSGANWRLRLNYTYRYLSIID
jgi:hypothetical protein